MSYKLFLKTHFSAAHKLTNAYDEKCNLSLHGHNFIVKVNIEAPKLVNNMVIDFKEVKEVMNFFDHKNLNEVMSIEPTAENISKCIYDDIALILAKKNIKSKLSVEVEENEGASITYNGE